jgi:hypothetical protein
MKSGIILGMLGEAVSGFGGGAVLMGGIILNQALSFDRNQRNRPN